MDGPLLGAGAVEHGSHVPGVSGKDVTHLSAEVKEHLSSRDDADGDRKDSEEELRMVVIGDRAFTDVLLAKRIERLLGSQHDTTPDGRELPPRVLAVQTTELPMPRDVRVLRWLEGRLAGEGTLGDWRMFEREVVERVEDQNGPQGEAMGWRVVRGVGKGVAYGLIGIGRVLRGGFRRLRGAS